ncbi:MAG: sodium-dependent transporter [Gammaproteobacteria bacterium]
MAIRESSYGYWSSHRGFLLVAAGAAIGIGNIARLPYLAGEHGGLIFLLAYFVFLGLVSWPLLVAEWMIGRWTREDLILGLGRMAETAKVSRAWTLIGVLALAAAVLTLSYFSVVAGWSVAYAFRAAGGALADLDAPGVQQVYYALATDPERSLAWHTILMVVVCLVVAAGVRQGIERAANYLVPGAFAFMLAIAIYAYTRGDTHAAIQHMLAPDWSRFGWKGALEALQQAFFTMALGLGAMVAYGAYLPADAPVLRIAAGVVVLDTVFSLLAGGAVYSLIFAAGLDPTQSITLLFQVFPLTLSRGVDTGVATATYLMMFMITLSAAVALMESAVRYLVERLRVTRVSAAISCGIVIWFLGLGTLLSFNAMQSLEFFGHNFFDVVQWLTAKLLLPVGGLLLCVFVSRFLPDELLGEMWGTSAPRALDAWKWMLRFPARIALIVLLVYTLGLLDLMVEFWSPGGSTGD